GTPPAGLYFFNGSSWQTVPSVVNSAAGTVTGTTTHFTMFGALTSGLPDLVIADLSVGQSSTTSLAIVGTTTATTTATATSTASASPTLTLTASPTASADVTSTATSNVTTTVTSTTTTTTT